MEGDRGYQPQYSYIKLQQQKSMGWKEIKPNKNIAKKKDKRLKEINLNNKLQRKS